MTALRDALVDYILDCKSQNMSAKTIRWYDHKLRYFNEWYRDGAVEDLTHKTVQAFLVYLKEGTSFRGDGKKRSTYTVKSYAQVLKSFMHWLGDEGTLDELAWRRVKMPKVSKRIIRTFTREMLDRLVQAASNEVHPWLRARDGAILHLLFDTGMRADELCTLRLDGLHLDPSDPYVVVIGKGDKERVIGPLGPDTQRLVRRYLRTRPKGTHVTSDTLILSARHEPLTPSGLDKLISRLERWAGEEYFPGIRVSAHTFRHTFAVTKLREGMDLLRISLLLGHTSIRVTENYLKDFQQQEARFSPVAQQAGRR